jgi:O-methyltransferase
MGQLRTRLRERFGEDIQELSLLWDENTVATLLGFIKPAHALEVGTHRGGSSAMFAMSAPRVTTIDNEVYPLADEVWAFLGVADRIERRIVASESEKHALIADLDFDFALLDAAKGTHGERDFDALKRCGCVLLRDYKPEGPLAAGCHHRRKPEWAAFIDSLSPSAFIFGYRCSLLALWLGETSPHRDNVELMRWLTRDSRITEQPE